MGVSIELSNLLIIQCFTVTHTVRHKYLLNSFTHLNATPLCPMFAVIKTGESGLTVFRLLTKDNRWKWVQANARLVYKSGKPDYIIATQRPLVYVPS